jgi:hypothetical protein
MTERKCYDCVHRREVPGSAHSACHHPATADTHADPVASLVGLIGRRSGEHIVPSRAAGELHIEGVQLGIQRGWFLWPVNFDPTWLVRCEGFVPIPAPTTTKVDR